MEFKRGARKQSLYLTDEQLQEVRQEAERLERSMSWVVQKAWKMALEEIRKIPAMEEP